MVAKCIDEIGMGFIYAPAFHPAMKYAGPSRKEIGIRTIFNILGPLTNPAGAKNQLLGVFSPKINRADGALRFKIWARQKSWWSTEWTAWMRYRYPTRPKSPI